ncbi:MAG: putative fatty acid-CoA racemase [Actinomycetia bacterium]|nr:putative fatty acid-CoA racemase [Actinomycetes bacterium]
MELAGIGPGPFAAMLLSELGADVVRVDRPASAGRKPPTLTRGRRSVVADLKVPEGRDALLRLAERAHVLIEGYRPGVAERLGLGPDDVRGVNPALVYARMTGWGQDGPWAHSAGHDINYVAITGVLAAIGKEGGPPQIPLNLVGDFGGGSLYLVVGVLAALLEARASGLGQVIDCAIVDGVSSLASMMWEMRSAGDWGDARGTNLVDGGRPFYDLNETADGGWFSVGALEPQFFEQLVSLLGVPEWIGSQHDPKAWPRMRESFAAVFATRTRAEWETVFGGTDACAAPVLTWQEAASQAHLATRSTLASINGCVLPGPAPRFSRTPGRTAGTAPAVGSSTAAEVMEAWQR